MNSIKAEREVITSDELTNKGVVSGEVKSNIPVVNVEDTDNEVDEKVAEIPIVNLEESEAEQEKTEELIDSDTEELDSVNGDKEELVSEDEVGWEKDNVAETKLAVFTIDDGAKCYDFESGDDGDDEELQDDVDDHWDAMLIEKSDEDEKDIMDNKLLDWYLSDENVETQNRDSEFEDDIRGGFDNIPDFVVPKACLGVPEFVEGMLCSSIFITVIWVQK